MTPLTPKDRAKALGTLRQYLPSLQDRLGAATAFLDRFLREGEAQQGAELDFELHADGRFGIDGRTLPKDGKGLALAWIVLACEQYRVGHLQVNHVSNARRPWVTTKAMLNRAADQVERFNPDLATAIRAVGTERGQFVLKHPVRGVRCTSADLARIFSR